MNLPMKTPMNTPIKTTTRARKASLALLAPLAPLLAAGTCHAAGAGAGTSASAPARPNIVLILVDDFGYECITANGGQSYKTPNVDKLAATGIRFESCHVQPLCTPTRVQLMTGMYNIRNYLNFGTLMRDQTTFGNLLKKAGYATAIGGKWQLGRELDSPQHFGFDDALLWQHTRRPARYANPGLERNGKPLDYTHGEYGPTLVSDFALDFITRHKDGPFFLYYPMMLTHSPFQPTPDSANWDPTLKGEKANNKPSNFRDMVAYHDKLTGQLVAHLEKLGIRDNTLIIYLGDNGTGTNIMTRFKGADYKGGKGQTTMRGTHVPLIVNWPRGIKNPGVVYDDLVSSVDFLPTLCEAAGIAAPKNTDGVSFLPRVLGEKGTPREWLYMWYSPRIGAGPRLKVDECAFDNRYKLYRDGRLFDMLKDFDEKHPIALDASGASASDLALKATVKKLQGALDQFTNARPKRLDDEYVQSFKGKGEGKGKKKGRAKSAEETQDEAEEESGEW